MIRPPPNSPPFPHTPLFRSPRLSRPTSVKLCERLPCPCASEMASRGRCCRRQVQGLLFADASPDLFFALSDCRRVSRRSEEHTSELQSRPHLVCRLLLDTKH